MNDRREYHETDSFTLGEHSEIAADTTRIAFAQTAGEVVVFDTSGRETVTLSDALSDLEVERYLICLTDNDVSAYTTSGVELWTQTIPGATDIIAFGERDVLAVLTADGTVVGLDLETGGQLFETHRPHEEFTDTHIAGGNGLLCIGAWSFVVCIDTSGSVVVDRNLNSTVEGVSVLDGLVLVALKDGTVAALDAMTGERQWSNSAPVRHLSPRGHDRVPALTESGVVLIHAEGRIEQLAVETGQRIVSNTDESVLGIVDDTSIRIHRRGPPPSARLAVDVLTTELDTETPVRVYVENTGSTRIETTLSLASPQQFRADSRQIPVELAAGESREVAFRLRELPATDQLEYELLVDETELEHGSIPIARHVDLSDAVAVDVTRQQVTGDTMVVQSRVENSSDTTLDTVRIDEHTVTDLHPGEAATREHEVTLGESDRTVQVEITHRNTTEIIERQLPVPDEAVRVEIARGDGEMPWLNIDIQPTVETPVRGALTVALPSEMTLSRGLELDDGEQLTLAVFLPSSVSTRDEIPVVVGSPLLATETRTRVDGWDERTSRQASGHAHAAGVQGRDRGSSLPTEQSTREQNRSSRGGTDFSRRDGAGAPEENPVDGSPVQIERSLPSQGERGTVLVERLRVTNTSRRTLGEVTVSDPFGQYRLDELDVREQVTVQRRHAFFDTGTHELPPVRVDGERTAAHEVRVVEPDIECWADATYDSATRELRLRVTVTNRTGRQCTLLRAGIDIGATDSGQTWSLEEPAVVDAGETETWTHRTTLSSAAQPERRSRLVVVEYEQDGDRGRCRTLTPLTAGSASGETPFSVTLLDKSRLVAETQGIVDVAVENESQEPLEDGRITVEGETVMETALSQDSKTVPRLAPGEQETLLVDVMPETTGTATFDVVVEGTIGGDPVTQRLQFAGPVAETGDEWGKSASLEDWTTDAGDEPTRVERDETHLVTRLQPTEEGSHR